MLNCRVMFKIKNYIKIGALKGRPIFCGLFSLIADFMI